MSSYRWDLQPLPPQVTPELVKWVGKYAAKVLVLRGVTTLAEAQSFVDPKVYIPTPALTLPDMDRAVDRILQAKARGERVLIWGDFDCDGVTSTSLLLWALRPLQLDLHYTIPLRANEGHGLNPTRLQDVVAQGTRLIITVDCGVANHAEIATAQGLGIDVIVTDHHLLPDPLPNAYAVVNPLRLDDTHPLRFLPGVGVAYKLAEALYDRLGLPNVEQFLDFAVTGIVADVAVLQRECRYLVQQGLRILTEQPHLGLQLLIQREIKPGQDVSAQDIGFRIAPKLNAIGRLDDASLALELLTTSDPQRAETLIDLFLQANQQRRELTDQVYAQACEQAEQLDLQENRAIVLAGSDWNHGVVGIAASKLVETYGWPTVLIALNEEKGEGYGSGRSIPTVNIVQAMDAVAPLLDGYGGHPMAAGLRVSIDNVPALKLALTRELSHRVSTDITHRELPIEIYLDWEQFPNPVKELDGVFEQLAKLEPYGHGNPRPTVALLNVTLNSRESPVRLETSKDGKHLSFQIQAPGSQGSRRISRKLWWWGEGSQLSDLERTGVVDIAFVMEASTWRDEPWSGKVKDVRAAGQSQPALPDPLELEVIDRRQMAPPIEARVISDRQEPNSAPELLLQEWPWLPSELAEVLHAVRPQRVILAGKAADFSEAQTWITLLVQAWVQGIRDCERLSAGGMPKPLVENLLVRPQIEEGLATAVIDLVKESQAFQDWFDVAPVSEIRKLMKRLLRQT